MDPFKKEDGLDFSEFHKRLPNLTKAIEGQERDYELYGIKIRSHTMLTILSLVKKYEK